jgi:glycosyltransferase involved in cell wall biosynthesis
VNILLSNSSTIYGGGEDYVLILAKFLRQRGHRVFVSALPDHLLLRKCEGVGIETVPVEYRGMNRVFTVAAMLRKEMQRREVEIVHSNANYDRTCAALAIPWTNIRHVAGVHSSHSIQHNITHWIRNHYGVDHFITDADSGRDVLVREDGIDPERITTVPIGIEYDTPEFLRAARQRTRSRLGIPDDTVVVGNVARLVPFKGQRFLLDAVAEVRQHHANILFLVIGDGDLLEDLQRQAETLGIADAVRFLGFQDDLHEWYPAFDVYCHSSVEMGEEMFPIAVLRALATRLPVVCTDVGGIAEMVEEGTSGYLVRPEDSHVIAGALSRLLASSKERASMGVASFDLFLRRYDAALMSERVEAVYQMVRRPPNDGTHS